MEERLQKILSAAGLASRRRAEELIAAGRVQVNGRTARLGDGADPARDLVTLDGKAVRKPEERHYLMLNKPRGFVTTLHDEAGRRTVADLVANCGARVYPVGRLDLSSEGLLLLTDDGAFAQKLMHPSHAIKKVYLVWTCGKTEGAAQLLRRPICLDGRPIQPPQVRLHTKTDDTALWEITICEGRNRQIRRMCDAAGLHVTRLRRIAEGPLQLGDLPSGQWRALTAQELRLLEVPDPAQIASCKQTGNFL